MHRIAALSAAIVGAAAYPEYLECANDTATRLKIGGATIMSGPPQQCGANCSCALAAAKNADGTTSLTIKTTATVNFAVRVNDGAGKLSSTSSALTSKCDGQMYSNGGSTPPPPGSFDVTLTPGTADVSPVFTVGFTDQFGVPLSVVTYPPTPPADLYKCVDGKCQASPTGVSLKTCNQLCQPVQLYRCEKSKCVAASTGVPQEDCSQMCEAPPAPAGGCEGEGCLKCVEKLVRDILDGVKVCLKLNLQGCVQAIGEAAADIADLVKSCKAGRAVALGAAAKIEEADARLHHAAATIRDACY